MRRIIAVTLAAVLALQVATGCSNPKTIGEVTYDTYGLFNENDKKNPDIQYEISWGNVFWGVVLFETVIAPIYFFGFDMFEPVGKKPAIKGQILQ